MDEREQLMRALNPSQWTPEMSTAWHRAIPDTAFAALRAAALTTAQPAPQEAQPVEKCKTCNGYEPTMDIYAKPGTQIRFRAGGGYDWQKKKALEAGFVMNGLYTVKRCDVGSSHTDVLVDEIPGRWNSCLFADTPQPARAGAPGSRFVPIEEYRRTVARCIELGERLIAARAGAELVEWVVNRWHAEVANRPLENRSRRPLDDAWRQMLRHLGVDDIARLGPTHDELLHAAAGAGKEEDRG